MPVISPCTSRRRRRRRRTTRTSEEDEKDARGGGGAWRGIHTTFAIADDVTPAGCAKIFHIAYDAGGDFILYIC
jgi:hypothetical protein